LFDPQERNHGRQEESQSLASRSPPKNISNKGKGFWKMSKGFLEKILSFRRNENVAKFFRGNQACQTQEALG
jgi:hypothetical protein